MTKRKIQEQQHNYTPIPGTAKRVKLTINKQTRQLESVEEGDAKDDYGDHVELRATQACLLFHSVAHLCLKFQPTKSYESYLSDTAAVQVGKGFRVKSDDANVADLKLDAAHMVNTSFRMNQFMADKQVNPNDESKLRIFCSELETESGATTPQSKYDNIGPDKVIDTYQTQFKNNFLKNVKKTQTVPKPQETYTDFITGLNRALTESKSKTFTDKSASGWDGGLMAKERLKEQQEALKGDFPWDLADEFKLREDEIGRL